MPNVIILGGGVAGITAALELSKKYKNNSNVEITLISRETYFLFAPNLYEVATSPEELTDLELLSHTITLPLEKIFKNARVKLVFAEVTSVDHKQKIVEAGGKKYPYNILLEALGSKPNYFNTPGAEKYSYSLKNIKQALLIRNKIEFVIQAHRQDINKDFIRIVVAGGGFAGVEIAGELKGYLDFLAWKNNYPRHKLQVYIVEGTSRILPTMSEKTSTAVRKRLEELNVVVLTNRFIGSVDEHFIHFKNGEVLGFDCLIWTAGIEANKLEGNTKVTDRMGRVVTVGRLESNEDLSTLYLGDQACVMDAYNNPCPATIPSAEAEGKYAAYAVGQILQNKKPLPFIPPKQLGYFITVGGEWSVLDSVYFWTTGKFGYFVRWCVYLHFFAGLIGWSGALKLSLQDRRIYRYNDPR
jgi:NADH dehydrogenase